MKKTKLALNSAALLALATTFGHAQNIGVHFDSLPNQEQPGFPGNDTGATVDPNTLAGFIPQLNFNNVSATPSTPDNNGGPITGSFTGLLDSTGANSGVNLVDSSTNGVFAAGYVIGTGVTGNNESLLATFLDSGNGQGSTSGAGQFSTFTLTGLAGGPHLLTLYIAGDQESGDIRGGTYTINGTSYVLANNGLVDSSSGTFILSTDDSSGHGVAGNYFQTTFTGTGLTVTTTNQFSNNTYARAPIDGFQVTNVSAAAPEPTTWALMAMGLLTLAFAGRRRILS